MGAQGYIGQNLRSATAENNWGQVDSSKTLRLYSQYNSVIFETISIEYIYVFSLYKLHNVRLNGGGGADL